MLPRSLLLSLLLVSAASGQGFVSGRKLDEALNKPAGGVWTNLSRRAVLDSMARAAKTAVLVDRRIDPTVTLTLEAAGKPLRDVLIDAAPKGTLASVVADVVYLGPADPAGKLRTAILLRDDELKASGADKSRQLELIRAHTLTWEDLQTPRQLLEQISRQWELPIEGGGQVPHDLWHSATLPNVSAAEALSLILIQFDLTFAWTPRAEGIRIVPLPNQVAVVRQHPPPRGATAKAAAAKWMEEHPGLSARVEGTQIVVTATAEQHDALAETRRPPKEATPTTVNLQPIGRVRFSLKWDNALRGLFDTLSKAPDAQLTFEYDEAALKAAGINLDQRIRFEVTNATAAQLLKAAFDPVGIKFSMQDRTVTLSPK